MADKPLHHGLTQALHEWSYSGWVTDISQGDRAIVSIDHTVDAEFAGNPYPAVVVPEGFIAIPLSCDDEGNASSGARCVFMIENVSAAAYYGGYYRGAAPDCPYTVTRKGVLH